MIDFVASEPGPIADEPLLRIDDLRTDIRTPRHTVHAVDGVSFSVRAGETVGLVGESGCGKTMTGLSVLRLLPPGGHIVGGKVLFRGRDLATASREALREVRGGEIGFVFQDPMTSLNPTMSIGRQIAESYRTHRGVSWKAAYARAREVLDLVGMPRPAERLKDYPHQLSGGLRQRVMIAIALVCEPKLLIADEPTTALDVTIQDQILSLLDELKSRLNMGMLLVTHDMGVIADRADRVVVMYAGKVAETAPTRQLFGAMRHPYTDALLEAIPTRETDRNAPLYSIPGLPPSLIDPPQGCRFAPRCRFATDECRAAQPPLLEETPEHAFACIHPLGAPASATARQRDEAPALVRGASPTSLLQLRDVVKEFPVTAGVLQREVASVKAVSQVSLDVHKGEVLGLVGESGCGKTTLGRMIVALEPVTSGTISFDGAPLTGVRESRLRPMRRNLQLMFQDPYASLDPRMRVGGLIKEPLTIQRVGTRSERNRRLHELLDLVGLPPDAAKRYPHEFSGGQRQRIGLARALALQPQLLVADEPVSALDVSIQAQILNLMRRLRAELDLTYVFISHDLSVIRYIADRIAVMYLGKLVEIGPAEEVFERPAHPYTRGLLDAVPEPTTDREKRGDAIHGELPSALNPPSGCRFRTRCPRAQQLCADVEPPLRLFGDRHEAACHFPLQQVLDSSTPDVPGENAPSAESSDATT